MGFSFVHLILLAVIAGVIFGPKPFRRAGHGVGEFWRSLKRSYRGEEDIEVTASTPQDRIEEKE